MGNNLSPRSHFKKDVNLAELWKKFKADREREEAWKEAHGVYNVRQAPSMKAVDEYEERQLLKHEQ